MTLPDNWRFTVNEDWARAIEEEHRLYDELGALLDEVAPVAVLLWHLGDGYGGYVIEELKKRVDGLRGPRPERPPLYTKKSIGSGLRRRVFERDEYRCVECGSWIELTVDHVIPESKGGPTTFENLQTMCRTCNLKKGTKMPDGGPP